MPLVPYINFGGASQDWKGWPAAEGSQVERAALATHNLARYWLSIRREQVSVVVLVLATALPVPPSSSEDDDDKSKPIFRSR